MAKPSPPSEHNPILDLSHIAAAISSVLASDFARLSEFSVTVPELSPVVEPLKRIDAWSREQTSHNCRNLLRDALRLVVLISERSQDGPTDPSELLPAIEQTVASILDISDHIDLWTHIPRRLSSRWQPTIEATIAEHEEYLKSVLDHLSGAVPLPEDDGTTTSEWQVEEGSVYHSVPWYTEEPAHSDSQPGPSGIVENSLTSEVPETTEKKNVWPPVPGRPLDPTSRGHEDGILSVDSLQLDHRVHQGAAGAADLEKWINFITVIPGQDGRFKIKIGSSPIYGGFSDVWECDAKFSDGTTISVGSSKQAIVPPSFPPLSKHFNLFIGQVAVKKFRAVRIPSNADEDAVTSKLLKRLSKELRIWMSLKHPNITPLLGFVMSGEFCMISPWYSNGNVASYISQHPEADRIKLVTDVACGLSYLHNRALPVIHGDMKPDNVLVNETGDAVIIDFGLSSVMETEPTLATSFTSASLQDAGNARWMAPELLMEEGCHRSFSTDIYSFGCVALYIYTEEIPFKSIPTIQIIHALIQGQKPVANRDDYPAISAADAEWFYGMLVSCWSAEPSSRPSLGIVKELMRGRKIGTQGKPFETGYYDILEVKVDATTEEIKKAYRRMALLHHPDKHPGDPTTAKRFIKIGLAYEVLSDPKQRRKYNEFGVKACGPRAFCADLGGIFPVLFGGRSFVPIIGEIEVTKDIPMNRALKQARKAEEEETSANTMEGSTPVKRHSQVKPFFSLAQKFKELEKEKQMKTEQKRCQEERVQELVENLDRKLSIYVQSVTGASTGAEVAKSWRDICRLEAENLKMKSYGVELLHTIGFVYAAKSRHYLASYSTPWGAGGWLHNVKGKCHIFSETFSTSWTVLDLKPAFDELATAEISPKEKERLQWEKGMQIVFMVVKLEIAAVIRETCDRLLADKKVPKDKLIARATALGMLGDAYLAVRKDSETERVCQDRPQGV